MLVGTLVATDVDSTSLTYRVVAGGRHTASCVVEPAGDVHATRRTCTSIGVDSFTFRANDGTLDSNVATVTITVRDVTPPRADAAGRAVLRGDERGRRTSSTTRRDRDRRLAAGDVRRTRGRTIRCSRSGDDGRRGDGDGRGRKLEHGSSRSRWSGHNGAGVRGARGHHGGGDERGGRGRDVCGDGDRCSVGRRRSRTRRRRGRCSRSARRRVDGDGDGCGREREPRKRSRSRWSTRRRRCCRRPRTSRRRRRARRARS